MRKRTCRYFLIPVSLLDDDRVPDTVYRRYEKLLKRSYEDTGEKYGPIVMNNRDVADLWKCNEDAARACIAQMRDLNLIATEQIGRTERRIQLLIAWRSNGNDSAPETNAPEQRAASAVSAPTTTAQAPAQSLGFGEGAKKVSTLGDYPSSSSDIQNSSVGTDLTTTISSGCEKSSQAQEILRAVNVRITGLDLAAMTDARARAIAEYIRSNPEKKKSPAGFVYTALQNNPNWEPPKSNCWYGDEYSKFVHGTKENNEYVREHPESRTTESAIATPSSMSAEKLNPYRADGTHKLWNDAKDTLRLQMTQQTFDSWFANSNALGWDDATGEMVIGVHSPYAKEWIEGRFHKTICGALKYVAEREIKVRYEVIA